MQVISRWTLYVKAMLKTIAVCDETKARAAESQTTEVMVPRQDLERAQDELANVTGAWAQRGLEIERSRKDRDREIRQYERSLEEVHRQLQAMEVSFAELSGERDDLLERLDSAVAESARQMKAKDVTVADLRAKVRGLEERVERCLACGDAMPCACRAHGRIWGWSRGM